MSGFKIILLVCTVAASLFRLKQWRDGRKASPEGKVDAGSGPRCPFCQAEAEPGFLECWKCGKKFIEIEAEVDSKSDPDAKEP
ncbi:MAG: hypothetical protein ISQ14_01330 [Verrucomicrobiae bacterium]|jgi:hypothetical protein|nr:hypothetical protein [Verrucomicrobiae bacterium]